MTSLEHESLEQSGPKDRQEVKKYVVVNPIEPTVLIQVRANNRVTPESIFDQMADIEKRLGNDLGQRVRKHTIDFDASPLTSGAYTSLLNYALEIYGEKEERAVAREISRFTGAYPAVVIPVVENGLVPPLPYQYRSIITKKDDTPLRINHDREAVALILDVNFQDRKVVYLVKWSLGAIASFQPDKENSGLNLLGVASVSKMDTENQSLDTLVGSLGCHFQSEEDSIIIDSEVEKLALVTLLSQPKARQPGVVDIDELIARDQRLLSARDITWKKEQDVYIAGQLTALEARWQTAMGLLDGIISSEDDFKRIYFRNLELSREAISILIDNISQATRGRVAQGLRKQLAAYINGEVDYLELDEREYQLFDSICPQLVAGDSN